MPELNDAMRYANVVSKAYVLPQQKVSSAIQDFMESLVVLGKANSSLPFFSAVLAEDGWMRLRMHIALKAPVATVPDGLRFDSYFYVTHMASLVVCGDIEDKMPEAFSELNDFLEQKGLRPTTPPFIILSGDETLSYTIVKVGYTSA
ncbi:MAG: DUF5085 family protein [Coriobacteriales bacterium]|jgi:hypothetical protein|nr:DUF5085 family protein [Coriobacteriales bacterium]